MKIQIPWQKHRRVAAIILKSQGQRLEMVTWILQLSFYKRDSLNLDFPSLGKSTQNSILIFAPGFLVTHQGHENHFQEEWCNTDDLS